MRHSYFGARLSRNTNERKNLIRNLLRSLILHGAIKTSKAKAKAIQGQMDKLITKAKKNSESDVRSVVAFFGDRKIAKQLVDMSATRFSGRTSGYTRIVKIGAQLGDATEKVLLSFVDETVEQETVKEVKNQKSKVKSVEKKEKTEKTKRAKKI